MRSVTAEFNGERIVVRTWPAQDNHAVIAEFHYYRGLAGERHFDPGVTYSIDETGVPLIEAENAGCPETIGARRRSRPIRRG